MANLITNGDFALWPASPELLTDGGMEIWASATNLTNWTEGIAGGSTVNREATIKRSGSYSCNLHCVAGALSEISQTKALSAATWYRLAAFGRTDIDKAIFAYVYDLITTDWWRPASRAWAAFSGALSGIVKSSVGAFSSYSQDFVSVGANNYIIGLRRSASGGADNYDGYWDDASLIAIPTQPTDWTTGVAGTSYVIQSLDAYDDNDYSVEFIVDALGSDALIFRDILLTSAMHRITIAHKETGGAQIAVSLNDLSTGDFLQADMSWAPGAHVFEPATSLTYVEDTIGWFIPPTHLGGYALQIQNGTGSASQSVFVGEVIVELGGFPMGWINHYWGLKCHQRRRARMARAAGRR